MRRRFQVATRHRAPHRHDGTSSVVGLGTRPAAIVLPLLLGLVLSHGGGAASTNGTLACDAERWRLGPILLSHPGPGVANSPWVDVVGAARLSDGRIVIGERGANLSTLRPDGTLERDWFEVQHLGWIRGLSGDRLMMFEGLASRLLVLEAPGPQVLTSASGARFVGLAGDGTLVSVAASPPRDGAGDRITYSTWVVLSHDANGAVLDTLAVIRGPETLFTPSAVVSAPPLRVTHVVVGEDAVFISDSRRFEVIRVSIHGGVAARIFNAAWDPVPIEPGDLVEGLSRMTSLSIGEIPELPMGQHFPAISGLLTDRAGNLWVGNHPVDRETGIEWFVLTPSGDCVARITFPPGSRPLDIGDDWVVTAIQEPTGTTRIELRRLFRGRD